MTFDPRPPHVHLIVLSSESRHSALGQLLSLGLGSAEGYAQAALGQAYCAAHRTKLGAPRTAPA
jgi:hypothetical protein